MRSTLYVVLFLLFVTACSQKEETAQEKPDQATIDLIGRLQTKVDGLSSEEASPVIKCESFTISTWNVMTFINSRYAARIEQLLALEPQQITKVILDTARDMAVKKLIYSRALAEGYAVEDTQVDSALINIKKEFGGDQQFEEFKTQSGYTDETFRADTQQRLVGEAYLKDKVFNLIDVSADEVKAIYEQDMTATVRHILLNTEGKTDAEKLEIREKMTGILAEARGGADFSELAKKYTEDPGSRTTGGLYENFERGKMVKPFEDASFTVPVGEISDIVETRFGYHIIKVENRKSDTRPFEQVSGQIENQLMNQKRTAVYQDMMKDLMDQEGFEEVWPQV